MRILHVISSADRTHGGPIEGIIQLNIALKSLGHSTEVVTLDAPGDPALIDHPLTILPIGPGVGIYHYGKRLVPWLRQHAFEYDHIIVNGIWQYHSFGAWRALHKIGKPYIAFTHGMLDPWFKRTYPLKHLKKLLYWPWADYRVLRDAKCVCFTCKEELLLARQSFALYRCNEFVVNYGTSAPTGDPDMQREVFFSQYPQLRGKRMLLFLSRIHVKKGCDLLINAFAKVASIDDNLHLVIAGPDKMGLGKQLQEQAKRLGIADRITWPGMLSGDTKFGAFHAAEAFVLPSHQENFGIAVAEALACGLPVLVSNKVNIWREIVEDEAGLVADDTIEGTIQLLRNWLTLPAIKQGRIRQKAVQCFQERFEIKKAAQSLLSVLQAETMPSSERLVYKQ